MVTSALYSAMSFKAVMVIIKSNLKKCSSELKSFPFPLIHLAVLTIAGLVGSVTLCNKYKKVNLKLAKETRLLAYDG